MTHEQFANLAATSAGALAPFVLAVGHVTPERLAELAKMATDLAQRISTETRLRYQATSGSI
jgi:hypothetical protein